ncbi:MAG: hypothetical protein R6U88_05885 [Candidatus Bipolaricaulota bacterium]
MYRQVKDVVLHLSAEDVLRGQGIDPGRAPQRLVDSANAAIEETHALVSPAALYTIVNVTDFEHYRISFEGGSFEGPLVARATAGAQQLSIALCTIGESLERRVEEMMRTNMVAAVALDGAGTAALRKVSQAVEAGIKDEACKRGLTVGMRAQPGQEGWPIEQQRQVFSALPAHEIGIRLTDEFLMIPKKSVSFVIPSGRALDSQAVPCDVCSKRSRCGWRKESGSGGIACLSTAEDAEHVWRQQGR